MAEYYLNNHIIIDTGSCYTKAGYNGENAPRTVIPTLYGTYLNQNQMLTEDSFKKLLGRDCISNPYLKLSSPVQGGKVKNWDEVEALWEHIFANELKVTPEAHNIFMLESLFSSNEDKERTAEIMFEKFNIFNFHSEPQPIMTLYSTTKYTGLIIESGAGSTLVVPIYESYILSNYVKFSEIGGEAITNFLSSQISSKLKKYKVHNEREYSQNIKEKLSEVSLNPLTGSENFNIKKLYELPDGNSITLGDELVFATEGNFNPGMIEKDGLGIHEMIVDCVDSMEATLKKDFYANIVLGGGNTSITNYPERLKKEIGSKINSTLGANLKLNAQPERKYSAWIGASVICTFNYFQSMWTCKSEYEESGHKIVVHKKNYL